MGKRFDLGASQAQASTCQQACTELGNNIQQISATVAQAASSDISGMGGTHVKDYAESVVVPMLQAAIMLSEAVKQGTTKLPQQYVAKVDSKSHSEDELQEEVTSAKGEISMIDDMQKALNKIDKSAGDKFADATKGVRTDAQARLQKAEQILQHFRNYDGESGALFGDIDELSAAFDQGTHVMQSVTVVNGVFGIPVDLEWAEYIKGEWEKYGKLVDKVADSDLVQTGIETVWEKLKDEGVSVLRSGIEKGASHIKEGFLDLQLDSFLNGDIGSKSMLYLMGARFTPVVGDYLSKGTAVTYAAYQWGKALNGFGHDLNTKMNPGTAINKDLMGPLLGAEAGIITASFGGVRIAGDVDIGVNEAWNYAYRKPWFRHPANRVMDYITDTYGRNAHDIDQINKKYHMNIPVIPEIN
ncbi:T7SS effector LXG polymorphic toxin [Ligilactobacillus sp. LYQ60]|uniref:T7SS effector LXG polymorphic toxin n=1 Tax=Ligilactobacillus sp. LYQ60 TaxID=3378799 RepID=UPI003851B365